jgi:hypothetical protein
VTHCIVTPSVARGLLLLLLFASAPLDAQTVQAEARFEAIGPRPYVYVPAVAFGVRTGRYVRTSIGTTLGDPRRIDVLSRFSFDPFRERRLALSVGGGVSVYRDATYLAIVADLEGPTMRRLVPFVQAGLGGGPRFSAGIRQAIRGRR